MLYNSVARNSVKVCGALVDKGDESKFVPGQMLGGTDKEPLVFIPGQMGEIRSAATRPVTGRSLRILQTFEPFT